MNKFELNIGLAGNALSLQGIISEVYEALGKDCITGVRIDKGEYKGEPEDNVVIKGQTDYHLSAVVRSLANLASTMEQECVAFASEQVDVLIYNHFHTGEKLKFSEEFFVRYE